jgi:hypothetical protein
MRVPETISALGPLGVKAMPLAKPRMRQFWTLSPAPAGSSDMITLRGLDIDGADDHTANACAREDAGRLLTRWHPGSQIPETPLPRRIMALLIANLKGFDPGRWIDPAGASKVLAAVLHQVRVGDSAECNEGLPFRPPARRTLGQARNLELLPWDAVPSACSSGVTNMAQVLRKEPFWWLPGAINASRFRSVGRVRGFGDDPHGVQHRLSPGGGLAAYPFEIDFREHLARWDRALRWRLLSIVSMLLWGTRI